MFELLVFPVLAAICLSLASGPLGAFVVWRRSAYFGETIAHAALLGVALALLLHLSSTWGILLSCASIALLLGLLEQSSALSRDTLLGILAQGSLALGIMLIGVLAYQRVDLMALLLGDILTLDASDFAVVALCALLCVVLLARHWKALLLMTISEDLARAEGVNTRRLNHLFNVMLALLIAVAVKVVGVLLIGALLVIPAAAARKISSSPEAMAICATAIGLASVFAGLLASFHFNAPAGPAIVCSALCAFAFFQLISVKNRSK